MFRVDLESHNRLLLVHKRRLRSRHFAEKTVRRCLMLVVVHASRLQRNRCRASHRVRRHRLSSTTHITSRSSQDDFARRVTHLPHVLEVLRPRSLRSETITNRSVGRVLARFVRAIVALSVFLHTFDNRTDRLEGVARSPLARSHRESLDGTYCPLNADVHVARAYRRGHVRTHVKSSV